MSRMHRQSSALMPVVARVHEKDAGFGRPDRMVHPGHFLAFTTGVISVSPTVSPSPFCITLSVFFANSSP